VYGDANTCQLMEVLGVKPSQLHEIGYGERFNAGNFQVTTIEGHHPWLPGFTNGKVKENLQAPLRARDYRMKKKFQLPFRNQRIAAADMEQHSYNQGCTSGCALQAGGFQ
jgi:hypothetical protein